MGGFDYPDQFIIEDNPMVGVIGAGEAAGFGVLGAFLVVYLLILLASLAVSLAAYVLQSLGYYTVAERRGLKHPWLAWLPIGNLWILGSISDQYQYVTKGKVKNRRKLLLGLSCGLFAFYVVWAVALITAAVMADMMVSGLTVGLIGIFGGLLLVALAILLVVFQYICLYDLYRSCTPDNAVLYLILSIVVNWVIPLFVFICRKQDLGMPPRRQPTPPPVYTVPETPAEPPAPEVTVPQEGYARPDEFED